MIYQIDLVKYILGVNRPSWSFRNTSYTTPAGLSGKFSNRLFRFLCGLLSPLISAMDSYNYASKKMYALASSDGSNISAEAYLDHYYGRGAGYQRIYITTPSLAGLVLSPEGYGAESAVNFFKKSPTSLVVKMYNYMANGTPSVVNIPDELENTNILAQIKADLNALTMYGFKYRIVFY